MKEETTVKKSEIRFTLPESEKNRLKREALDRGMPMNRYICQLIGVNPDNKPSTQVDTMQKELGEIRYKLAHSANLPREEVEKLKERKYILRRLLES